MDKKTSWHHVLEEPVISLPGEPTMKAELDARFDGTFEQFTEWLTETFKNPANLRVRVIVGSNFTTTEPDASSKLPSLTDAINRLHTLAPNKFKPTEAEAVIKQIYAILQKPGAGNNQAEISAVKLLRTASSLGLSEAKAFIESLPSIHVPDDVPF